MLAIIALFILLLTPALMALIRLLRPRFAYQYLLALFGTAIALALMLASRSDLPHEIQLISWQTGSLFPYSPAVLLDRNSWALALAISAITLGVILTEVTRLDVTHWRTWAGGLLIASFGILAVLAGNPMTLLIAWAALDITEAAILMLQAKDTPIRRKITLVLSARAGGIIVLMVAMIAAWSSGEDLSFISIQPHSAVLLLMSAGFRTGIFPLHIPFILETEYRRGLGTLLRLVSTGASLILIVRTASTGLNEQVTPYLLGLVAIAALYGAAAWATAPNELSGRTFWILGMISFSLSASIRAQPEASLAWGIACLLSGALIFLASPRNRYLVPLLILGVLSISSLPFTPLWQAWQAYGVLPLQQSNAHFVINSLTSIVYLIANILLVLGYIRHLSHQPEPAENLERWMWILYLPGLLILILTHYTIGLYHLPEAGTIPLAGWVSGAIVFFLTLLIWMRGRSLLYKVNFIPRYLWGFEPVLHLSWLYRLLEAAYRLVGRIVTLVSNILEGEGGLLWTMLIVVLLFSLLRN